MKHNDPGHEELVGVGFYLELLRRIAEVTHTVHRHMHAEGCVFLQLPYLLIPSLFLCQLPSCVRLLVSPG